MSLGVGGSGSGGGVSNPSRAARGKEDEDDEYGDNLEYYEDHTDKYATEPKKEYDWESSTVEVASAKLIRECNVSARVLKALVCQDITEELVPHLDALEESRSKVASTAIQAVAWGSACVGVVPPEIARGPHAGPCVLAASAEDRTVL